MNCRLLNEVLIEWNESSKEDSDNIFLKSEDIKKSLDRHFVYRLDEVLYEKARIKIFDVDWHEYLKYRDKVWINGKHVKLDNGWTVDKFEPGEYKVYIEDIDKVTDMTYMFYICRQLVSAFIPDSVIEIGELAFHSCTGLTSVTIPDSVMSIGSQAFDYCTNLTSVTIPNSVTSIDTWAFYNCSGLTSITIGNSVTSISQYAFDDCINIKTVYVEDINKFNQIEFKNKTADPRCYGAKLIELKK